MPNRILKESICTSDTLAGISAQAERLWWRIVAQADDFGRFDARPETIRGQCMTALLDRVSNDDIRRWLDELQQAGLLLLYAAEGKCYLQITTWNKHQKRRAKYSKYPAPTGNCQQPPTPASNCGQVQTIAGLVVVEESRNEESRSRSRSRDANDTTTTTDSAFAYLVAFWQDNGFGPMLPLNAEKLRAYLDDGMEPDLVRWAMEQAVAGGVDKLNFRYVEGILKRLQAEGVKSKEQAEAQDRSRVRRSISLPDKPIEREVSLEEARRIQAAAKARAQQ